MPASQSPESHVDCQATELKAMKNRLSLTSGLALTILFFYIFTPAAAAQVSRPRSVRPVDPASLERQVFNLINQTREENGLKKLTWNDQVAGIARMHSSDMAANNFFSHIGLDGKKVSDRADAAGLSRWRSIGENIAYNAGFDNPVERAIYGWMNSEGHRMNILRDNWQETGIGVAVSAQGKFYITQVFLKRK